MTCGDKSILSAADFFSPPRTTCRRNYTREDPRGTAEVREFTPGHYRIHYRCATASLLRIGSAYFPGWTANLGNLRVVPVDYALMGGVVPLGEQDLVLDYHSTYFLPAALLTLSSSVACGAGLLLRPRR